MTDEVQQMQVDIAVVKQQQIALDRRHDEFMNQVTTTMAEIKQGMDKVWTEINSIHGHTSRCKRELEERIDKDIDDAVAAGKDRFMTKTEGETIRGSIIKINTKLTMTGLGIVLAVSLVQVAIAVYT